MMTTQTSSSYSSTVSIAKGICIILMVVGHSGCPDWLGRFIYLFHMPVFFFVSGYLFKEKYLIETKNFVIRRIKTLWWPFVKWSLIFLVLHNCLTWCGIYNVAYSWADAGRKVLQIFTMTGSEQLLGGFWFLKELLYASVLSCLLIRVLGSKNVIPITGGVLILSAVQSLMSYKIPTVGALTFLSSSLFMAGYAAKQYRVLEKSPLWVSGVAMVFLMLISSMYSSGMKDAVGGYTFLYFSLAVVGCCSVLRLSESVQGRIAGMLDEVGRLSLYVLIFHFSAFKLVTLVRIWCYGMPYSCLSSFPVIDDDSLWWWIIYTIVGVGAPFIIARKIVLK